jgi:tRNA A-37 threonylcarbamoyl transferase component Bud32
MGDLAGRNLGPYRILEQVGAGGMATVYKAYHAAMDRYVAIKMLPQHLASDPHFRARFQREARTIARLEHRYILPVHDVREDDGISYMVMRYIDSGDLGDLIASHSLSIARAAQLVAQVAEALAYAHRQGIIHRDVKPANVLLSRDGDALLTDFGIAKIYEETLQLTSEGMMVGTPTYMAPEQLQGRPVDARSDIYALGVVLYQALTGEPPFMAETPLAVAMMHIHNPLRQPRQFNPKIPESLERIILRALAKNPDDRFQTADEMAEALRYALAGLQERTAVVELEQERPSSSPPAPPTVAGRRMPWGWLAGGAAAVALVLALLVLNRPTGAPGSTGATPIAAGSAAADSVGTAPARAAPGAAGSAGAPPTQGPAAGRAAALPAGPTMTPRAELRSFSNTSAIYDMAVLGDTVWAATAGGLVRYSADGVARVFSVADGLPFNWTPSILAAPDGTLWAGSYNRVAHIRPVVEGLGDAKLYEDNFDIGDIHSFMVDSDGSIWAGGAYGVRRFDGQKWAPPDLPIDDPALKDVQPDVRALLRDRDGALWVGLAEGLLRWDGKRWTRFSDAQGVGKAQVSRLLQDRAGTIWAAAGAQGLLRYDAAQDRWQKIVVTAEGEEILSIAQLADGRLWASSADGIASSADEGARWQPVKAPEQYAGNAGASRIVQDDAGRIWIGAGAGVSCCAEAQWRLAERQGELPAAQVGRLTLAPDGKLWMIESYGGAAAALDPASMRVEPSEGLDDNIGAVAFSKDTEWLGTKDAGVVRRRGGATLRISTADGLPSDAVRALLATDTALWIGTNKGLAFYELATGKVGTVEGFENGIVDVFLSAPNGDIWAGSIREGSDGLVALGRYDGKVWQIWREGDEPLPKGSSGVTALAADAEGHVWAGVWGGGLHTWDGAAWKNWAEADGAPQGNVVALTLHNGELWAAGQEGDLYGTLFRWNKDGWAHFEVEGLSSLTNDMRFTDDGALWLATSDGLLRLSQDGVAALR